MLCANQRRHRCPSFATEGTSNHHINSLFKLNLFICTNSYLPLFCVFQVGISTNEAGEKVGTFALAYAAHKAASPIRFPPTVALTPVVAGWIGKIVGKEK